MEASPFTQPGGAGAITHCTQGRCWQRGTRRLGNLPAVAQPTGCAVVRGAGGALGNSPGSLPAVAPADSRTQRSRPAGGEDGLRALTSNPRLHASRRLGTVHGKGLCSPRRQRVLRKRRPVALRSSGFFQGPGPASASLGTRVPPEEVPGTCHLRAQAECSRGPRLSMSYMSLEPLTEQSRQDAPGPFIHSHMEPSPALDTKVGLGWWGEQLPNTGSQAAVVDPATAPGRPEWGAQGRHLQMVGLGKQAGHPCRGARPQGLERDQ